jgi:probable rRNA maturation factor
MNQVDVNVSGIEAPSWLLRCAAFAKKVLQARGIRNWELSILLCDDLTIQGLNRRYRNLDEPTDVLSFGQQESGEWPEGDLGAPAPEPAQRAAGDVVVSLDSMRRNAEGGGIEEHEELKRLLIHGILHLEGLDHSDRDSEMIGLQERILASLKEERVF